MPMNMKMDMKTINGQSISEEPIDAWVADDENGYDVESLRRQGGKPRDERHDQDAAVPRRLAPWPEKPCSGTSVPA